MKKLIFIAVIPLLLMHCSTHGVLFSSKGISLGGGTVTVINTTIGQELLDLQQALDSGAITQKEYDELRLKIIDERYDTSADSTFQEIMEMIFGSEVAPADSTDTN